MCFGRCSRTDTHRKTHTEELITILRHRSCKRSNSNNDDDDDDDSNNNGGQRAEFSFSTSFSFGAAFQRHFAA